MLFFVYNCISQNLDQSGGYHGFGFGEEKRDHLEIRTIGKRHRESGCSDRTFE